MNSEYRSDSSAARKNTGRLICKGISSASLAHDGIRGKPEGSDHERVVHVHPYFIVRKK
jgi:hypothetical protein